MMHNIALFTQSPPSPLLLLPAPPYRPHWHVQCMGNKKYFPSRRKSAALTQDDPQNSELRTSELQNFWLRNSSTQIRNPKFKFDACKSERCKKVKAKPDESYSGACSTVGYPLPSSFWLEYLLCLWCDRIEICSRNRYFNQLSIK